MWKLKELALRNIISFQEASLTIEQGVATLIFGKNEDNDSQPCNGSGKSALIEAISFGLTGEQLRKVKSIEEIINDQEEDAFVRLILENDYDNTKFVIERTISRSAPQIVSCHKFDSKGNPIDKDKTVQPTVLDYNRMILDEIGLTKDDIYNNFILCDNKYEGFFDCSDKNKKEIINRFSNGNLVDESIARVQNDMVPVESELNQIKSKVSALQGSINAIEGQLAKVDELKLNERENRKKRIEELEAQILKSINEIALTEGKKDKGEQRLKLLKNLQKEVLQLENSDLSLSQAYAKVHSLLQDNELGEIDDYEALSIRLKQELDKKNSEVAEISKLIEKDNQVLLECEQEHQSYTKQYETELAKNKELAEKDKLNISKLTNELNDVDSKCEVVYQQIKENIKAKTEIEVKLSRANALLQGAIECPVCSHKFFVGEERSVEAVNESLKSLNADLLHVKTLDHQLTEKYDSLDLLATQKEKQIDEVEDVIQSREKALEAKKQHLKSLYTKVENAASKVLHTKKSLVNAENELDRINGKIEVLWNRLFREVETLFEQRITNGENFISQQISQIDFLNGQLNQFKRSRKELIETPETDFASSLKTSLSSYQKELSDAIEVQNKVLSEFNQLKEQEVNFTMFKSYLARKKIDALSLIVNDFLEKIGSDIRLRLEGFSVTRTGKLRDRISVQVMRDGIDCGSYQKFSGGEKARLNLACILSLHTLTNANCEKGKGLDFIIIDELLDKSDEVGIATYCEALNKLKQTSLLITQGAVSESYPHTLLITKKQGVSTILN